MGVCDLEGRDSEDEFVRIDQRIANECGAFPHQ
jgi:hypothetical protein